MSQDPHNSNMKKVSGIAALFQNSSSTTNSLPKYGLSANQPIASFFRRENFYTTDSKTSDYVIHNLDKIPCNFPTFVVPPEVYARMVPTLKLASFMVATCEPIFLKILCAQEHAATRTDSLEDTFVPTPKDHQTYLTVLSRMESHLNIYLGPSPPGMDKLVTGGKWSWSHCHALACAHVASHGCQPWISINPQCLHFFRSPFHCRPNTPLHNRLSVFFAITLVHELAHAFKYYRTQLEYEEHVRVCSLTPNHPIPNRGLFGKRDEKRFHVSIPVIEYGEVVERFLTTYSVTIPGGQMYVQSTSLDLFNLDSDKNTQSKHSLARYGPGVIIGQRVGVLPDHEVAWLFEDDAEVLWAGWGDAERYWVGEGERWRRGLSTAEGVDVVEMVRRMMRQRRRRGVFF